MEESWKLAPQSPQGLSRGETPAKHRIPQNTHVCAAPEKTSTDPSRSLPRYRAGGPTNTGSPPPPPDATDLREQSTAPGPSASPLPSRGPAGPLTRPRTGRRERAGGTGEGAADPQLTCARPLNDCPAAPRAPPFITSATRKPPLASPFHWLTPSSRPRPLFFLRTLSEPFPCAGRPSARLPLLGPHPEVGRALPLLGTAPVAPFPAGLKRRGWKGRGGRKGGRQAGDCGRSRGGAHGLAAARGR